MQLAESGNESTWLQRKTFTNLGCICDFLNKRVGSSLAVNISVLERIFLKAFSGRRH